MEKIIYGHENIKRAIEVYAVAKTIHNFPMYVVGRNGFGVTAIEEFYCTITGDTKADWSNLRLVEICETDTKEEAIETAEDIRSSKGACVQAAPYPLYANISRCRFLGKGYESRGQVRDRVDKAIALLKENQAITVKGNAVSALFENAFNRLHLSYDDADTCLALALAIKALDGAEHVEPQHIAEAINYCCKNTSVEEVILFHSEEKSF
jgi:hypothetical protein